MPAILEAGITKNQIISELAKSEHGKLEEYIKLGTLAAKEETDFLAHLISWNSQKGQIRDSKVALPIISLASKSFTDQAHVENSLANLALLAPKYLVHALRFEKQCRMGTKRRKMFWNMISQYLRNKEKNQYIWNATAVQHRNWLQQLYRVTHTKPAEWADQILFKNNYPKGSVFAEMAAVKNMSPHEVAVFLAKYKIPALLIPMLVGPKLKEPDILMCMIERMSATELNNQAKFLNKLGMQNIPAAKAAFEQALAKASINPKANALRTAKAIEMVDDEDTKAKLRVVQAKQMQTQGIDGDWLILADRSPSMQISIEASRVIASTLTKMVRGKVHLVFFDSAPTYFDVTGKTYDEILNLTKRIGLGSATSIGCGLQYMLDSKQQVDGIAIISDGGENRTPTFAGTYQRYCKAFDCNPTCYLYLLDGSSADVLSGDCKKNDIDLQQFDLRGKKLDLYSLPNLTATMRVSRYSLVNEIMETPLLTLQEVFA